MLVLLGDEGNVQIVQHLIVQLAFALLLIIRLDALDCLLVQSSSEEIGRVALRFKIVL